MEDGRSVTKKDIENIAGMVGEQGHGRERVAYRPRAVLMQDFTGGSAVVDLAAMRGRDGFARGDPEKINPLVPSISSSTTR